MGRLTVNTPNGPGRDTHTHRFTQLQKGSYWQEVRLPQASLNGSLQIEWLTHYQSFPECPENLQHRPEEPVLMKEKAFV